MSGDVEAGSPRPRPLSGGFWTLLSWLRREEQSSSNESLSSAGSDRTAVSFAFLAPAHYHSKAPPVVLPPPGPPTDTYKNRVRERNLRRQYERDITLHRKYGLLRGEGSGSYDAFSLPPARRSSGAGAERPRRATSECFTRRAAHVPGKRRAPPPPALQPAPPAARKLSRKRPAPQPPTEIRRSKENINYSYRHDSTRDRMSNRTAVGEDSDRVLLESECKPEKYTKKDPKDVKIKTEKSFLKQIFENKKRNSTYDTSAVKVLPSISELDKQAAEIIQNNKIKKTLTELKTQPESGESFGCKCKKDSCLCNYIDMLPSSSKQMHHRNASTACTQTERDLRNPSLRNKDDEKQKLKEMLKEMKDSLPKRTKQNITVNNIQTNVKVSPTQSASDVNVADTPTLRIGSPKSDGIPKPPSPTPRVKNTQVLHIAKIDTPTVIPILQNGKSQAMTRENYKPDNIKPKTFVENAMAQEQPSTTSNKMLHTPLKISALLNPIYVPRSTAVHLQQSPNTEKSEQRKVEKAKAETTSEPIYIKTADTVRDIILNSVIPGNPIATSSQPSKNCEPTHTSKTPQSLFNKEENSSVSKELAKKETQSQNNGSTSANSRNKNAANVERLSEHSRRRELVIQLEQSIAKGDERAAAEAAAKLAQLRLSCSVLSFSSQILGEPSTSSGKIKDKSSSPTRSKEAKVKNDIPEKNTESLPDLIKREDGSSKLNKFKQLPENKIQLSRAKASTSKEITEDKMVDDHMAALKVWIEDKEKARGPIQLHVKRKSSVGDLRRQAENTLGLPARLQRWIVGRTLCTDDNTLLTTLAGPTLNAPFYLCIVESDTTNEEKNRETQNNKTKEVTENVNTSQTKENKSSNVYSELVNLERQALVPNPETFECDICMEQCLPGDGVVLRECVHCFCKGCLSDLIRHCEEPTVSCPATGCAGELHEREIRALVSAEEYQKWLARGLAAAESGTRNAFHCRTRDCTGWALCEIDVRRFPCPVCKHTNCVPCQAIHENQSCEQYQAKLKEAASQNSAEKTDEGTQALIDGLISRGEALQCPECSAIITKKWGCDWVKCSACKTEICWVTKGRRWGPGGRGDSSGGCRCGVDGKRCHPTCGYCH